MRACCARTTNYKKNCLSQPYKLGLAGSGSEQNVEAGRVSRLGRQAEEASWCDETLFHFFTGFSNFVAVFGPPSFVAVLIPLCWESFFTFFWSFSDNCLLLPALYDIIVHTPTNGMPVVCFFCFFVCFLFLFFCSVASRAQTQRLWPAQRVLQRCSQRLRSLWSCPTSRQSTHFWTGSLIIIVVGEQ